MRNFDYLKDIPELANLYEYCNTAELTQQSAPDTSALNARRALEWIVRAIYAMKGIEVSPRTSLFELIDGEPFRAFVGDDRLMMAVHYIRKVGNKAAHLGAVAKKESFFALLNIYNLTGAILVKLQVIADYEPFNNELIPASASIHIAPKEEPSPSEEFVSSVNIESIPEAPVVPKETGLTEAETRRYYINMMLAEAGWDVLTDEGAIMPLKACIEVKVNPMPNNEGVGYADYVLFGANGKPLAVIEAKRTSVEPLKGRHQATLYADALEQMYGVRPVIYCTNGYKTEIIDGLGYPVRSVYGYHTAADLELLIQRRGRQKITDLKIDDRITNREYQKRAIRSVCERLNNMHRRTLLVMATGTGKTRVSISLTDVLLRNEWVKNVLFLADRTALVKQAAKNFAKLLPNTTTCILSEEREPDMMARIMFSTYQTMINYIDRDTKDFSIGRFDLIIVDEAHRSVFGKYTAIFDYFDGMLVGLTATPREEVEKNTFDLFNIDAEDTFAYELDQAVDDGFLVPYSAFSRTTTILKTGIKYDSLSVDEQKQLESIWEYEKARKAIDPKSEYNRDIDSKEIFKYIFNQDTIDKVLQDFMSAGLKVESGDKIGKTIIFAYNHKHAELIVQRFAALYPEYGADFCVLIDNYVNYAQNLIDRFEVRGSMPQIAVSVDMLDTGIDVPDILNLVFFKPVYSKIKFAQMIGRGTRLSEDIFGAGQNKKEFYIFDWCGNFEFFNLNPNGKEALPTQSLSERLFCIRTDIAFGLQRAEYQADEFAKRLHDDLKGILHGEIETLNDSRIAVRQQWALVDKYRKKENWAYISQIDVENDIKGVLSHLIVKRSEDESAKKFDLLMLNIELELIDISAPKADKSRNNVVKIGQLLQERASIPQVAARMNTINEVLSPTFWETSSLFDLERVRTELRELVQFILGGSNKSFVINIDDEVIDGGEASPFIPTTYKQRVIDFLANNMELPVIRKIMHIEQLTHADIIELERIMWKELGTKEEYAKYVKSNNMLCGDSVAAFIRSQVGVDRGVALERFSDFLSGHILNTAQEEYLKSIIVYVCQNGDITTDTMVNVSPFDNFEWGEVFGQKLSCVGEFVKMLHDSIVA